MGPPSVQQPARLVSTAPTEAVNAVAHTNTGTCRVFKVEAVEPTYWLGVTVTLRIGSSKSTRERKESVRLNRLRRRRDRCARAGTQAGGHCSGHWSGHSSGHCSGHSSGHSSGH
eukprot:2989201-Pyramimonas_sp.AAC.1